MGKEIRIIILGSILILGIEVFYFYFTRSKDNVLGVSQTPVSSPTTSSTQTPTPEATSVPTPFATPKPTAKAGTPIPQPTFTSQQINEFIDKFSGQYGVDPNVMRHIALCESGFNPAAKNYIYRGLYQFGPVTWQNIRKEMGEDANTNLRLNAEEEVQTAAYAISKGKIKIWPNCQP